MISNEVASTKRVQALDEVVLTVHSFEVTECINQAETQYHPVRVLNSQITKRLKVYLAS